MTTASIQIREVKSAKDLKRFITFPWRIYRNDPNWVPPLIREEKKLLTPGKNPFWNHAERALFIAVKNGAAVGRIAAIKDHTFIDYHREATGYFGFFESVNEPPVAAKLFSVVQNWLKKRGLKKMIGPLNPSTNAICGFLLQGFDFPPKFMMPYTPPYYLNLAEASGLVKAKDLLAYRIPVPDKMNPRLEKLAGILKKKGLSIRNVDMKNFKSELELVRKIYNAAWADNWGFVPLTEAEVAQIAEEFKLIVDPDLCMIAEYEGEPAAMALALPNINEAFRDLDGRLLPTGWAKLLYRLKVKPVRTFRLIVLGIREKFRGTKLGALSVQLYAEIHDRAYEAGYQEAEASWTLADNDAINDGMEFMGADQYKTYRVFEKEL